MKTSIKDIRKAFLIALVILIASGVLFSVHNSSYYGYIGGVLFSWVTLEATEALN